MEKVIPYLIMLIPYLITLIPFGIALLIMMLHARKRGAIVQGVRTASHLLSIALAYILAPIASRTVAESFIGAEGIDLSQIFAELNFVIPGDTGIPAVLAGFISPVMFFVLWVLIGIAFAIVYAIVRKIIVHAQKEKEIGKGSKAIALALAFVTAFAVGATFTMPVVGTMRVISETAANVAVVEYEMRKESVGGDVDGAEVVFDFIREVDSNVTFKAVDATTGWMFDGLTTIEYLGEKGSIAKDLPKVANGINGMVGSVTELMSALQGSSDISKVDLSAMERIATYIDQTPTSRIFGCVLMRTAASAVSDMKEQDPDNEAAGFYDVIVEHFSKSTPQMVATDNENFYRAFVILQKTYILVDEINQPSSSEQGAVDQMGQIFDTLTPGSATIATDLLLAAVDTGALNIGDFDMNALGGTIGDVFIAMSEARETLGEAEYRQEVEVFTNILDFIVTQADEAAHKVVSGICNSEVISSVLKDALEKYGSDPYGLGAALSEEQKRNISSFVQEHKNLGEDEAKLDMILQIFGIQG
ncbi:MAG: hypothetical protein J5993_04900 [Clostridia bacterium]|nr:hypothetical protein [Clostridia bacterium]